VLKKTAKNFRGLLFSAAPCIALATVTVQALLLVMHYWIQITCHCAHTDKQTNIRLTR